MRWTCAYRTQGILWGRQLGLFFWGRQLGFGQELIQSLGAAYTAGQLDVHLWHSSAVGKLMRCMTRWAMIHVL